MGRKPIKSSLLLTDYTVSSLSCLEVVVGVLGCQKKMQVRGKILFIQIFRINLLPLFSLLREHRNNCCYETVLFL